MRLRDNNNRLKIEHSIIDGLKRVLEKLLANEPDIRSIVPGRIAKVRDARGKVDIRITTPTQNGWKAKAYASGATQELFISTDKTEKQLEYALLKALGD